MCFKADDSVDSTSHNDIKFGEFYVEDMPENLVSKSVWMGQSPPPHSLVMPLTNAYSRVWDLETNYICDLDEWIQKRKSKSKLEKQQTK